MPTTNRAGGWQSNSGHLHRTLSWAGWLMLAAALCLGAWVGWLARHDAVEIDRNAAFTLRLERLLSSMKDLETGQRGFLLTGEERYLEPYNQAQSQIDGMLASINELGFPIGALPDLVASRRQSAARGIDIFRASGQAAAVEGVKSGAGKTLMDAIRSEVHLRDSEADARIQRLQRRQSRVVTPLALLAIALGLGAFAAVVLLAFRRRRAQQASATLLEGVLDNAPVGLGFLDAKLRVRHMNKALTAMSDRALSTGIGESIWNALPQLRESLEDRLQSVVDGGRPVSNIEVSAAGAARERARHFQVSFYPLLRGDARRTTIDGAGMVVADITARKRSEQRVRESEERFRTLTKAVSTMVWRTDAQGRFEKLQPEWATFTGQEFETYKDDGWIEAVHPDDRKATREAWALALENQSTYTIEHRLRRADGIWRYMSATAAPIMEDDGSIREWTGSHADITERREAELELEVGPRCRRGRQPRQERVPRQHEPRAAHAPVRGDRVQRDDGRGGSGSW